MRYLTSRVLSGLLLLAGLPSPAEEKIAAMVGNCRSLNLGPSSRSDPYYGTLSAFFTTYDGRTDVFPLTQDIGGGHVLLSGELRPRAGQPGIYEADFATFSSIYGWVQYGSIVASLPTTDSDGNGLPDVAQLNQNGTAGISGVVHLDWPTAASDTFVGTLTRGPNQLFGTYSFTYASDGSMSSGTMQVQNLAGPVSYVRATANNMTLSLTQTDPVGSNRTFTGSTTFTVVTTDQIIFPQFSLASTDNKTNTVLAGLILNRIGPRYVGNATLADGILETSWADAVNWVIEITDGNDSNTNGIPDLSDVMSGPPSIVAQPQSQSVTAGATVSFSVNVAGGAPLSYQWQFNGSNMVGRTASTLTISSVQPSNQGPYAVVVTNLAGKVTSSNAVLTVNVVPAISTQPQPQVAVAGSNATFSVAATGTTPLSYQWRFNSMNIGGATNSSISLTNVQAVNAGPYSVVVSNVAGTKTSAAASLTVNAPPLITTQPNSQSVKSGANVTFTVVASGTAPLTYRWKFNGSNIAGATATSYSVNNVQITNAGNYTVGVSNVTQLVKTATATLYVNSALRFANPGLTTNGSFQSQLIGLPTSNYILQASTDLTNWISLVTNSSAQGIVTLVDTNHVNAGHRAYRARSKL